MAINYKIYKKNLISFGPIILFYILSLTETKSNFQSFYLNFFSFNLQMMIIYFWVLKRPQLIGFGHIFFASLINDVVLGLPMGTSSIVYLILAFITTYIRNATLAPRMVTDWFAFIPAILIPNIIYFFIIKNFSNFNLSYIELLQNSFFTFLFYPVVYQFFKFYLKKVEDSDA
jgi:cell shape-determining protein MreD